MSSRTRQEIETINKLVHRLGEIIAYESKGRPVDRRLAIDALEYLLHRVVCEAVENDCNLEVYLR